MPRNPVIDDMWIPGDDDDDEDYDDDFDDDDEYEDDIDDDSDDDSEELPDWWDDSMPDDWLDIMDLGFDDYSYEEFEIGIDYGEDT